MRRENPSMDFKKAYKLLKSDLDKRGNVKIPNAVFRNSGGLVFENKTVAWGLDKPLYSPGSSFADLDNDGDLDLVLNNINDFASVYENRTINGDSVNTGHHYLKILLSGDSLNRGGIGAKISIFYGQKLQYYEHFPVRGFQSMVDPKIHFGLGAVTGIDSLHVVWPDRKEQTLYHFPSDQLISLKYRDASVVHDSKKNVAAKKKLFEPAPGSLNIRFRHNERRFNDFDVQPLLPHMYSQEGPGIAVGDVNSDGMDDFFIGGSTSYPGNIFIQESNGRFSSGLLPGSNNYEDMGALFFDADGDGDQDLYVVSGGSGLPPGNPFYADRLYINDGKGQFLLDATALPGETVCGSQVTASDYDRDGDLDLFVCGRVDIENYPYPPRSILLRNDSKGKTVRFTDVTSQVCPGLERPGLVAAALWTDFNRDGWIDLILAGEWMPLSFFKNMEGKFVNVTAETGLGNYTGWWNSLSSGDFDRDGDIDYVAGNLGLNTQYKVSQEQPMHLMSKDFDNNGIIDPVCSYYVQGVSYPIYQRNELLSEIPSLQNRFLTYSDYAKASTDDIFPAESRTGAYFRDFRYARTAVVENLGNGTFRLIPLPLEAQVAPVFGLLTDDFNADGFTDILLAGNYYSLKVSDGQFDALIGLSLAGNGKGGFKPVPARESGFFADGDTKAMASLSLRDRSTLILVARNADSLKVIRANAAPAEIIRLRPDDVSAEITYNNGDKEYREFYYGSGYLSQSSRVCRIYTGTGSVVFTSYTGETRTVRINSK